MNLFFSLFKRCFLVLLLTSSTVSWANTCESHLATLQTQQSLGASLLAEFKATCQAKSCSPKQMTLAVYRTLSQTMPKNLKAYSAILAVMLGTSTVTAVISSQVGADYPALSYFVSTLLGSVTTLGIYVIGAPVWEPLQSKLRATSFKWMKEKQNGSNFLEDQFYLTNQRLSTNAQWARSVYRDYLRSISAALYEARRASAQNEIEYVSEQLAEIILRLNDLFPDISPEHPIVLRTVHAAFTHQIKNPEVLYESVLEKIKMLGGDPQAFQEMLKAWLMLPKK